MKKASGFTMIELMVAMAIVAVMLTVAAPRYFSNIDKTKEAVLREDLYILRDAIDKFYADKNKYPEQLADLVTEKYLRSIPVDPYTRSSNSWVVLPPEDGSLGAIANVRSAAPNKAIDGTWFKDW
ncbi:type II secretion system protein [Undibacterium sp. LX40W]|uniref:Type II secretion system protein n=1 Tax=Undibacterium nitidum TaxID=2762298 RepID=A0A923HHL2_9BURK|nr:MULTISPECIES: type II secretion system protein [Undibacterium]MBC3879955.1 type II secretion system protein [Undibacterium nitidum]MBC3891309.1 type II secretion system protein [Undibacterium sp. LX40W]